MSSGVSSAERSSRLAIDNESGARIDDNLTVAAVKIDLVILGILKCHVTLATKGCCVVD